MKLDIDPNSKPQSIAIELDFEGAQPNHFGAKRATAVPMRSGTFIGDTQQGGSCNAQDITINAHCNGTHTESISHVINTLIPPHQVIEQPLMMAQLVTLSPIKVTADQAMTESYQPPLEENDVLLCKNVLAGVCKSLHSDIKALIIRTLPNSSDKRSYQYGGKVQPPFFSNEAMQWLVDETQIEHLLVDMPSVDRLNDDGLLSNHRIFWQIKPGSHELGKGQLTHKTITEMIYVSDQIKDGTYILNLQIPRLKLNAVPSNPILYRIKT